MLAVVAMPISLILFLPWQSPCPLQRGHQELEDAQEDIESEDTQSQDARKPGTAQAGVRRRSILARDRDIIAGTSCIC
jgi:hypothetical protein